MNYKGVDYSPIPGYCGYYISKAGEVLSTKSSPWRIRKTNITPLGYEYTSFYAGKGNPNSTPYIHHLMVAAFMGGRKEDLEVNHIDRDKRNNCLSNLEQISHSANVQHSYHTGRRKSNGKYVCYDENVL